PELAAVLVELDVHHAGVLLGGAVYLPAGAAVLQVVLAPGAQAGRALRVDAHGGIGYQPRAVLVDLDEQVPGVGQLQFAYQTPGVLGVAVRVRADYRQPVAAEVTAGPHRAELRVDPVGAAARVGQGAHVHHGHQGILVGVYDHQLVFVVGCHHEVPAAGDPTAVVQVQLRVEDRDAQGLPVRVHAAVVDDPRLPGFLDVDQPLGAVLGGHDG